MTQLQKIVAKAKTLKKSYPNTKWTDLIKKASKLVTPASKSVGATKKKKSVIKKAVVKKYAPVKPLIKKKTAVKKSPARSMHKDTKSHNVNIRVMSGISNDSLNQIKDIKKRILSSEAMAHNIKSLMKSDTYKKNKEFIREGKKTIIAINKTNRDYKKMITSLKKHIK